MFLNHHEVCDVVSLLLGCIEDDTFLLTHDDLGYWIPSVPVEGGRSWKKAAYCLLKDLAYGGKIVKSCKTYRIWKPPGRGEIHHVVFSVEVSLSNKKSNMRRCSMYKTLWSNTEDILNSYSRLRSLELLEFISVMKNEVLKPIKDYAPNVYPEGQWNQLIENDHLNETVEILESHIFPDTKRSQYMYLLETAEFTRNKQLILYAHFLVLCLPCTYMNKKVFAKFLKTAGWNGKSSSKLFSTADMFQVGFLSFRDFLYIMAVIEPKVRHIGASADLRSQYIFRYYDRDGDSSLSPAEFKTMVDDIIRLQNRTPAMVPGDVCSLATAGGSDVAISVDLFMDLISRLKLRGTSLLLRSQKGVSEICPQIVNEMKIEKSTSSLSTPANSLTTRVVTFFPLSDECVHLKSPGTSPTNSNTTVSDLNVEIHCVRLAYDGRVLDSDSINPPDSPRRTSENNLSLKKSFVNMHKEAQEDLIRSVQYFMSGTAAVQHQEACSRTRGKQSYCWGNADPGAIAENLLKVCDVVSRILATESRLVELKSPVCVVGDLRGKLYDLLCFEKAFWNLGPTLSPTTLLFLGDYADRGPHGVEMIAYLFARKMECPDKIILLRGSLEIRVLQQYFLGECTSKFGEKTGKEVWEAINCVMDCMPLAAIIDRKVFCTHGGIPPPWLCPVVTTINNIPCPLSKPDVQSPLAWELMWNEPLKKSDFNKKIKLELDTKEGFASNSAKGTGHFFDATALSRFLKGNGYTMLLRAHEIPNAEFFPEMSSLMLSLYSPQDGMKCETSCMAVYPLIPSSFVPVS